jgi:hypothetical protein
MTGARADRAAPSAAAAMRAAATASPSFATALPSSSTVAPAGRSAARSAEGGAEGGAAGEAEGARARPRVMSRCEATGTRVAAATARCRSASVPSARTATACSVAPCFTTTVRIARAEESDSEESERG